MDHEHRLRRDARLLAGDLEAAALFECLAEHVFDPALDTDFMGRVCGAPRPVRDRLAAKIGKLKDYVTKVRMGEAKHLVLDTEMPIKEIGKRVGYRVQRTFRRAFVAAHGVNPEKMRQEAKAQAAANVTGDAGTAPEATQPPRPEQKPDAGDGRLTPRALARHMRRRRDLGMLAPAAAAELRFKLRRRHPRLDQADSAPTEQEPAGGPEQADPATGVAQARGPGGQGEGRRRSRHHSGERRGRIRFEQRSGDPRSDGV